MIELKTIDQQIKDQKRPAAQELRRLAKLLSIRGEWDLHGQICDLIKELDK